MKNIVSPAMVVEPICRSYSSVCSFQSVPDSRGPHERLRSFHTSSMCVTQDFGGRMYTSYCNPPDFKYTAEMYMEDRINLKKVASSGNAPLQNN